MGCSDSVEGAGEPGGVKVTVDGSGAALRFGGFFVDAIEGDFVAESALDRVEAQNLVPEGGEAIDADEILVGRRGDRPVLHEAYLTHPSEEPFGLPLTLEVCEELAVSCLVCRHWHPRGWGIAAGMPAAMA